MYTVTALRGVANLQPFRFRKELSPVPGPFTHIYTARRVSDFLTNSDSDAVTVTTDFIRPTDDALTAIQSLAPELLAELGPQACGEKMQAWPKFTALGANGPDLFFFLQDYNDSAIPCDEIMLAMSLLYYLDDQQRLPDEYSGLVDILALINTTWAGILKFIIKLDQIWQNFLTTWNNTIGPILDAAGTAIDDLTGNLFSELGQAFTELGNALLALAAEEILSSTDVFEWFALKMRKGYDEQAFLWSDMTHYRRTSIVPARLIAHARQMMTSRDPQVREHADQLIAFALGWVCHVGTDVIAHSFVNEQCGGPFRTHWQRHHLIENHIDAWNYEQTKPGGALMPDEFCGYQDSYPGLNQSALYFSMQIPQGIDALPQAQKQGDLRQPLPDGDDSTTQAQRKALLDTDGELPLWLAETIVQVFIEVYAQPEDFQDTNDPFVAVIHQVQDPLNEPSVPHPRNLLGQTFQNDLTMLPLLVNWLSIFGVDNVGIALNTLREQIAPDPPYTVPEGFPLPWEVQATYRFMLSWFKRSYVSQFDMDRPQQPTVFLPPSSDVTNIINDFTGPPDFSGVNPHDNPLSQACEALAAAVDWVWKQIQDVNQFIYDVLHSAASLATWPAREVLYNVVVLPAWQMCENIRRVLAHMGYLMPQSEQLWPDGELRKPSEIDLELITLGHTVDSAFAQALAAAWDPLGNLDHDPALTNQGIRDPLGAHNPWLPIRTTKGETPPAFAGGDVVEFQRPWGFPDRTNDPDPTKAGNYLEGPVTTAGPYPQEAMPDHLLATHAGASNAARTKYEGAGCPTDTDIYNNEWVLHITDQFGGAAFRGTNPLGDPVVFSAYLIGQIANNPQFLSNFNLDADRGYGYLCWDWDRSTDQQPQPTDGQNHSYPPPKVWPEGADGKGGSVNWTRPDPVPVDDTSLTGPPVYVDPHNNPLELHYPGRACHEQPGGNPPDPRIQ